MYVSTVYARIYIKYSIITETVLVANLLFIRWPPDSHGPLLCCELTETETVDAVPAESSWCRCSLAGVSGGGGGEARSTGLSLLKNRFLQAPQQAWDVEPEFLRYFWRENFSWTGMKLYQMLVKKYFSYTNFSSQNTLRKWSHNNF
jgi:hypothetical protein